MTSPVPDALRTQLAEVLRSHSIAAFNGTQVACSCDRRWRSTAIWRDHVSDALAEADLLVRARAEGAAEALRPVREFVDATWTERDHELLHPALRSASIRARLLRVLDAAALSAPTTTEGDPT